MKKYILASFIIIFASCCTIKMQEGESELSFQIRSCIESAKKTGQFEICRPLIEQQLKLIDDKRLYDRYEYAKSSRDESQKFSEAWLMLNQR